MSAFSSDSDQAIAMGIPSVPPQPQCDHQRPASGAEHPISIISVDSALPQPQVPHVPMTSVASAPPQPHAVILSTPFALPQPRAPPPQPRFGHHRRPTADDSDGDAGSDDSPTGITRLGYGGGKGSLKSAGSDDSLSERGSLTMSGDDDDDDTDDAARTAAVRRSRPRASRSRERARRRPPPSPSPPSPPLAAPHVVVGALQQHHHSCDDDAAAAAFGVMRDVLDSLAAAESAAVATGGPRRQCVPDSLDFLPTPTSSPPPPVRFGGGGAHAERPSSPSPVVWHHRLPRPTDVYTGSYSHDGPSEDARDRHNRRRVVADE